MGALRYMIGHTADANILVVSSKDEPFFAPLSDCPIVECGRLVGTKDNECSLTITPLAEKLSEGGSAIKIGAVRSGHIPMGKGKGDLYRHFK